MSSGIFSDIAFSVLSKKLDAEAARQKAIANNIANVETPGYKRVYVTFEDELKNILATDNNHEIRAGLQDLEPIRHTDVTSPSDSKGNNVNIDAEIADLAKTALEHKAAAVLLEGKISMLQDAISGGK